MLLCSYLPSSRSIRGNICFDIQGYGLNSHLTSLQCACRLKSFFKKFLFSCLVLSAQGCVFSCLACQTVLKPRSRLVDFTKFYYNLKVTRGEHEFRHESTGTRARGHEGTRARGTKARVLDMLVQFSSFICLTYI